MEPLPALVAASWLRASLVSIRQAPSGVASSSTPPHGIAVNLVEGYAAATEIPPSPEMPTTAEMRLPPEMPPSPEMQPSP